MLKNISLVNFRNYESVNLEFSAGFNVLLGENGQGKTSLLEAVHFLSILRSFRCQNIRNLFRWGQNHFAIKGILCSRNVLKSLEVHYGIKRKLQLNGNLLYKASEYLGHLYSVTFVPDDMKIIKGSGTERRRFIDLTLSQLYPEYLTCSQDYYKALKSRNLLLRCPQQNSKSIRAFDPILVRNGAFICHYREQFLSKIEKIMDELSMKILSDRFSLKCTYNCSCQMKKLDPSREDFEHALASSFATNLDRDLQYRMTLTGSHRDDFSFTLNKKMLQNYGSEGQCRSAALFLKMAAGRVFLEEKKEDIVIFLVDDISGELDRKHRDSFFSLIDESDQVLFACTDLGMTSELKTSRIHEIVEGTVTSRSFSSQ